MIIVSLVSNQKLEENEEKKAFVSSVTRVFPSKILH